MRKAEGSSPGRTNTQGPKITEENFLPFYDIKKWIGILVFSDKDESKSARNHRRNAKRESSLLIVLLVTGQNWTTRSPVTN